MSIDIINPANINEFTKVNYSENYKSTYEMLSRLPIFKKANEIIKYIDENNVILIISKTGSGKTVLTPLLLTIYFKYEKKIAVTLPKQVITKKAAEFASKTFDVKLGEQIGYKYKGSDKQYYGNNNRVLYATDGTIVAMLLKDPLLSDFSGVIVDEIHERKVQIDFLLYLLKNTLKLRPEFKLILMSATINPLIFKSYFSVFKFGYIDVGGEANYPITVNYVPPTSEKFNSYLEEGYKVFKNITKDNSGDTIFFVPSISETFQLCNIITTENADTYCVEVYSGMDNKKEEIAISKDKYKEFNKNKKIIIATGVAESSITFEAIKYVIDSGYELFGYYDPNINANVLEKKPISKAQATQRCGRSGRTQAGTCYRLYDESFFKKMLDFPEPAIRTSNLYEESLKLISIDSIRTTNKLLNIFSEFIEPPKEIYIRMALSQLRSLKLIDLNGITKFGDIISNIQLEPMSAIAVYASKILKCSNEVLLIISLCDVLKNNLSGLFSVPKDKKIKGKFEKNLEDFHSKYGDHIALYKIIKEYKEQEDKDKFCKKYFIKKKIIEKAYKNYNKIKYTIDIKEIHEVPQEIFSQKLEYKIIASMLVGYSLHVGFLNKNTYDTLLTKNIKLNRFNLLLNKFPKKIVYQELFNNNGSLNLNIVSLVNSSIENLTDYIDDIIKKINI